MSAEEMLVFSELETPSSSTDVFTLPCGYVDDQGNVHKEIVVREMTGHEEDMLASPRVSFRKKVSLLIESCVVSVGPERDPTKVHAMVKDMYVGDRLFLLLAVRRVTFGDKMPYKQRCPHCLNEGTYVIDLSLLDLKEMPHPEKKVFQATLPSGIKAVFKNLRGSDEDNLNAAGEQDRASGALFGKLVSLNDQPPTLADVKNLSVRDRHVLRHFTEEMDGGVDMGIEFTCKNPGCRVEFSDDMTFSSDFFYPTLESKR